MHHRGKRSIQKFINSLAEGFPSLTALCISDMRLDNLSERFLSLVPDLTRLSLADNVFTKLPCYLHKLADLEEVSVELNPIMFDGQDLAKISSLPSGSLKSGQVFISLTLRGSGHVSLGSLWKSSLLLYLTASTQMELSRLRRPIMTIHHRMMNLMLAIEGIYITGVTEQQ